MIDTADLETALGVGSGELDATRAAAAIAAAEGAVEEYCGRVFDSDTYTETYDPPPPFTADLVLRQYPVISVTSVTVDGTALTVDDEYLVVGRTGTILRVSGGYLCGWGISKPQSIVVVYTAGYATIPAGLKDVVARVAARAYQRQTQTTGVKSEKLGDYAVTYADGDDGQIDENDRKALSRYRRLGFG